jgi:hypothetical protein
VQVQVRLRLLARLRLRVVAVVRLRVLATALANLQRRRLRRK